MEVKTEIHVPSLLGLVIYIYIHSDQSLQMFDQNRWWSNVNSGVTTECWTSQQIELFISY